MAPYTPSPHSTRRSHLAAPANPTASPTTRYGNLPSKRAIAHRETSFYDTTHATIPGEMRFVPSAATSIHKSVFPWTRSGMLNGALTRSGRWARLFVAVVREHAYRTRLKASPLHMAADNDLHLRYSDIRGRLLRGRRIKDIDMIDSSSYSSHEMDSSSSSSNRV